MGMGFEWACRGGTPPWDIGRPQPAVVGLADQGAIAGSVLADALDLATLERRFDAVIDCGLSHTFSDDDRRRYERGLFEVVRLGGRYSMLCFSDRQPGTMDPRRVSQDEIRDTFASGWRADSIVATRFATQQPVGELAAPLAWRASLARLPERVSSGAGGAGGEAAA